MIESYRLLQDYTPFVVPNSIASVLDGHTANIKAVRFIGAAGKHMVSGSSDNTVRIWDTATSSCTTVLRGHRSRIWDVDASVKGDRIASASGDKTIKVWNWKNPEEREQCATTLVGNTGDVYAARWHPMGVSSDLTSSSASGRGLMARRAPAESHCQWWVRQDCATV